MFRLIDELERNFVIVTNNSSIGIEITIVIITNNGQTEKEKLKVIKKRFFFFLIGFSLLSLLITQIFIYLFSFKTIKEIEFSKMSL